MPVLAHHPQEAVVDYAATQVGIEFLAHVGWQRAVCGLKTRENVRVVRLHQRAQQRALGNMVRVARRGRERERCGADGAMRCASLRDGKTQHGTLLGIDGCTALISASASPIGDSPAHGQAISAAQRRRSPTCCRCARRRLPAGSPVVAPGPAPARSDWAKPRPAGRPLWARRLPAGCPKRAFELPLLGRGGWTWYSGSASWMYRLLSERLLGLQREGDALILQPCIPAEWNDYRIDHRFGASLYRIQLRQLDVSEFSGLAKTWRSDRGLAIEALDSGGFRIRAHVGLEPRRHRLVARWQDTVCARRRVGATPAVRVRCRQWRGKEGGRHRPTRWVCCRQQRVVVRRQHTHLTQRSVRRQARRQQRQTDFARQRRSLVESSLRRARADQPHGCARPAVGNWCETAVDCEAAGPRHAEIPVASVWSASKPVLARPSLTRPANRQERFNFLNLLGFAGFRPDRCPWRLAWWLHLGCRSPAVPAHP